MTHPAAPVPPRRAAADAFPVVVIAASAGGIRALLHLFGALPADWPAAIAVVQHRSPRHPGLLAAVLHRSATLPVQDATPGERLQPGRILLAPADHHLLVEPDGRVALSTAARVQLVRPAADVLFASVAPVFTTRVIAVVLTGWGSDGTQGIQRVKHWGGTVIAQDEASSEVFEMPRSAIATGAVNGILSLEAIAPALVATVATLTQASTPIWGSRRNRRHAQHDMTPQTPGTPSPAQGLLPAWAGSPLAGQDSHLLDDEQSFMETSHPPIPFD